MLLISLSSKWLAERMMDVIYRIWRARATAELANAYQDVALGKVFPSIEARNIPGFIGIELLRRPTWNGTVEFATIMRFNSERDIVAFAGPDSEAAFLPSDVTSVLLEYDLRASHYQLVERRLRKTP